MLFSLFLLSCKKDKYGLDTVSIVDNNYGYIEVEFNDDMISYNKGDILSVFKNSKKFAIIVEGKGGYNGSVIMIILIENNVIRNIKNVDNDETKEKSESVFSDSYLNQFIDKDIILFDSLVGASKPSSDTDIIYVTSATYSSKAVLNAVNSAILWYKTFAL